MQILAEANKILSSSLDYNVTLASVAKLITDNMADFCMIDLFNKEGKLERAAARVGDPRKTKLANRMFEFPADPRNVGGIYDTAKLGKPVLIEKVTDDWLKGVAKITEERKVLKELGIYSLIYAPLKSRGDVLGVLTIISSKKGFSYDENDVLLAEEIAHRAGLAVGHARLYLEAQEAYEGEKQLSSNLIFLSEASRILSSSLDYKTTLSNVAKLAISHIADWCTVDILNEEGVVERVVIAHRDPAKIKWARQLRKERPIDMTDKTGTPQVLRTGKPELYPLINEDMITATAKSKRELELLRKINLKSAMIVPLFSNKKPIGTISLVTSESGKQYDKDDLATAEELATRASIAIENARLYLVAQDAIRKREEFMSISAHELRTPLTIILLHIQKAHTDIQKLMEKHTGMEKVVELLERSEKQGIRLSKMITELLDVSLVTAGKLQLEKEPVDLNTLMDEELKRFSIQAKTTKAKILFKKSKKPIKGIWDRIRLEQVISNLISNAIKYGKNKPIKIKTGEEDGKAVITIQDQGIGIKPQDRKIVFDLFKRSVSSSEYRGVGIGLYISKKIVELHDGEIELESKVGKGTKFTVRLPLGSN